LVLASSFLKKRKLLSPLKSRRCSLTQKSFSVTGSFFAYFTKNRD
jgi:hypothetical protein